MRVLIGDDIGFHVSKAHAGLVLDVIIEGLDDFLLEQRAARKWADDRLAHVVVVVTIGQPEDVHLHSRWHQGRNRIHVPGDTKRGVKCDRRPYGRCTTSPG